MVKGRVLVPGAARGRVLKLRHPISFWGGIDARTGTVSDPRHPDFGASVTGRVLVVPETVGSSSSSAIMLELLREGTAPAALLLGRADAIVVLGVLVARELGHPTIPVVEVGVDGFAALTSQQEVHVEEDGRIVPWGAGSVDAPNVFRK